MIGIGALLIINVSSYFSINEMMIKNEIEKIKIEMIKDDYKSSESRDVKGIFFADYEMFKKGNGVFLRHKSKNIEEDICVTSKERDKNNTEHYTYFIVFCKSLNSEIMQVN